MGGNGHLAMYKYNYPKNRVIKDSDDRKMGVIGTLTKLNDKEFST